jgi:hypothetical protein
MSILSIECFTPKTDFDRFWFKCLYLVKPPFSHFGAGLQKGHFPGFILLQHILQYITSFASSCTLILSTALALWLRFRTVWENCL